MRFLSEVQQHLAEKVGTGLAPMTAGLLVNFPMPSVV